MRIELRAVLVLTVREFDITAAYSKWEGACAKRNQDCGRRESVSDREGGAHPADRFQCMVPYLLEVEMTSFPGRLSKVFL